MFGSSDSSVFQEVMDPKIQEAVFGHAMASEEFYSKHRQYVKPEWYQNPRIQRMCRELYQFEDTYKRRPKSPNEFFSATYAPLSDMAEKRQMQQAFEMAKQAAETIGEDVISKTMTAWIKLSMYKDGITESAKKYNLGNGKEAIDYVASKIQAIQEASFEKSDVVKIPDPVDFYANRRSTLTKGVSTGHVLFDEILVGQDTYVDENGVTKQIPGLISHETTAVVGPANSGKSTFFSTLIRHAIMEKKTVLYMTHEDNWSKYMDKIFQSVLMRSAKDIQYMLNDEQGRLELHGASQMVGQYLKYIPYNKSGGMYVEDIIPLIRMENNKMKAQTGKGFDLLVSDYPGLLMSRDMRKTRTEHRIEIAHIYREYSHIADELGFHAVLGVQTNRQGYKQAREGETMLGMDSIGESFGIAQIAHNVITINRSEDDIKKSQVNLFVSKSRSSQTGLTFTSNTNMAASYMWGNSLQARTTVSDSKTINVLQAAFDKNKEKV